MIAVPELPREAARRSAEARAEEAEGLAEAIGIDVVASRTLRVRTVRPATLLGKGQVEEIAELAKAKGAALLIVDSALTPIQQKNLEDEAGTKVIDRTGLILEIFGERAATAEGRMQVELAHLDYQAGRLVRSWTHLERQRGGFGFLGGPGETQIEADRRAPSRGSSGTAITARSPRATSIAPLPSNAFRSRPPALRHLRD